MKFILLTALAALASTMKVSKADEAHRTIFEGCSKNSDCSADKYCITWGGAWNYCKEWCYYDGAKGYCN